MFIRRRNYSLLLQDLQEAKEQTWEATSNYIDLRIDNENLNRKVDELTAQLQKERDEHMR